MTSGLWRRVAGLSFAFIWSKELTFYGLGDQICGAISKVASGSSPARETVAPAFNRKRDGAE
jgi:hypothetical protein